MFFLQERNGILLQFLRFLFQASFWLLGLLLRVIVAAAKTPAEISDTPKSATRAMTHLFTSLNFFIVSPWFSSAAYPTCNSERVWAYSAGAIKGNDL
jgi:hypothetical protein